MAFFPEDVSARQRRVAAEVNLDCGREPPQIESVPPANQKGRLCQVHLSSYPLHPLRITGRRQKTDGRRIAGKRPVGKSIDLGEALDTAHGINASASISTNISGAISRLTSTIVVAGRMSLKNSPCARPTWVQSSMLVTYIRVRITSLREAPAAWRAWSMFRS